MARRVRQGGVQPRTRGGVDHAAGPTRRPALQGQVAKDDSNAGAIVRASVRQRRELGRQGEAAQRVSPELHPQHRQRAHDEDGAGVSRRGAHVRGCARLVLDTRRRRSGDVSAHSREVHRAAQRAAAGDAVRGAQGEVPGVRARDSAAAADG